MIGRNHDPVALTLTVTQIEDLATVVESFIAECGIPSDDPSESLPAVLRTLRDAIAGVPWISFGEG